MVLRQNLEEIIVESTSLLTTTVMMQAVLQSLRKLVWLFVAMYAGTFNVSAIAAEITDEITERGGQITLPGVGSASFPAGAFLGTTTVTLRTSPVDSDFDEFTAMFRPSTPLTYQLRVIVGAAPPISETVRVQLSVSERFAHGVPSNYQIEMFARGVSSGEETIDMWNLIPSTFDTTANVIVADLPTSLFSNGRSSPDNYEAVVTLAPTPGITRTTSSYDPGILEAAVPFPYATSQCLASTIACPVQGGCLVS